MVFVVADDAVQDSELPVLAGQADLLGEEHPIFVPNAVREDDRTLPCVKAMREKVFFVHRNDANAKHPILEHIEGDVDASVNDDHARVLTAAPAAARGIQHGRVAPQARANLLRVSCDVCGRGKELVKGDTVRTARIAEPRNAVHAYCAVEEMRAAAEYRGPRG